MTYRTPSVGTYTAFTSASSNDVPFPTSGQGGVAAGDVLVLFYGSKGSNPSAAITVPAGWTNQYRHSSTTDTALPTLLIATKYAVGNEAGTNLTVTHSSAVDTTGQIFSCPGGDASTLLDVAIISIDNTSAAATTAAIPTTTTTPTIAGAMALYAALQNASAGSATPPTGFTEGGDRPTAAVPNTLTMETGWKIGLPAAAMGSASTVNFAGSGRTLAAMIVLRPKPAITSSRATTWNTKATVTATRATTWNTKGAVAATTRATTWRALVATASTRATTWRVLAPVTPTRGTTWRVVKAVGSSRATTWNADGQVTASRATTWNVAAPPVSVTATRGTTWRVMSHVTPTTSATTWRTLQATNTTRATTWRADAQVSATRATTWNVRTVTTASRATTWRTMTQVAPTSRATTWRVFGRLDVLRATSWNTKATIGAQRSTTWRVININDGHPVDNPTLALTTATGTLAITTITPTLELTTPQPTLELTGAT